MVVDPVYESANFRCVQCGDCDIPGYLILLALPPISSIFEFNFGQRAEFGDLIARLEWAVATVTKAERVYVLRFSEGLADVHFHIFPRTAELSLEFKKHNPEIGKLIGEVVYGWARQHYRREILSPETLAIASRLRELLRENNKHGAPSASHHIRIMEAFGNTYGFEKPEYREETKKFSLFIWAPAVLLFLSKFLWGAEFVRFLARWLFTQPDPVEVHPAISEIYLALMTFVTFALCFALGLGSVDTPRLIIGYALWRIFEDVGSSFHSLVTRAVFGGRKSRSEFRYLVTTIVRSMEVWASLVLLWGVERSAYIHSTSNGSVTMLQVIYFVTTSITTVGYGDFVPNSEQPFALILSILTQFVSIAMIGLLAAKALSLVTPRFGPAGK